MKILRVFGPFLAHIGPKVHFAPGALCILLCCYQRWGVQLRSQKCVLKSFRGLCGPAKIG